MLRLHDLRLIHLRPTPVQEKAAKVIELRVRRAQRLERLQRHEQESTRPDAA